MTLEPGSQRYYSFLLAPLGTSGHVMETLQLPWKGQQWGARSLTLIVSHLQLQSSLQMTEALADTSPHERPWARTKSSKAQSPDQQRLCCDCYSAQITNEPTLGVKSTKLNILSVQLVLKNFFVSWTKWRSFEDTNLFLYANFHISFHVFFISDTMHLFKWTLDSNSKHYTNSLKHSLPGTSLVVQWLRIHLSMQGTRVWSLVRERRWHVQWSY